MEYSAAEKGGRSGRWSAAGEKRQCKDGVTGEMEVAVARRQDAGNRICGKKRGKTEDVW